MFARHLEQALTYEVVADLNLAGTSVERDMVTAVRDLKLDLAGVDGLIRFNRFYRADFDIDTLTVTPRLELSCSPQLLLRLRWLAILHGRLRASLGVCGGIVEPADAVKAILAGADAVQTVSAVLDAFERASCLKTLIGWNGASTDTDARVPRG